MQINADVFCIVYKVSGML